MLFIMQYNILQISLLFYTTSHENDSDDVTTPDDVTGHTWREDNLTIDGENVDISYSRYNSLLRYLFLNAFLGIDLV